MQIEWSISLGNIVSTLITLFGAMGAALAFFYALRSSLAITSERLLLLSGRVINIEAELREINKVMAAMAAQDQRLSGHTHRMDAMERDSAEWRNWVRGQFDRIERLCLEFNKH